MNTPIFVKVVKGKFITNKFSLDPFVINVEIMNIVKTIFTTSYKVKVTNYLGL